MKRKILLVAILCCIIFTTKNVFSMQYITGLWNYFTDGPSKLHGSIIRQDEQEVKRLLEKDVDPNSCYNSRDREFALYMNTQPEFMDTAFIPSIMLAAFTRNLRIVQLLCEKGAKIDSTLEIKLKGFPNLTFGRPVTMTGPTVLQMIAESPYFSEEDTRKKNSVARYLISKGASQKVKVALRTEYCQIEFDDNGNVKARKFYESQQTREDEL